MSARVVDVDVTTLPDEVRTAPHREAFVVVRAHGRVVGTVRLPCPDGVLRASAIHKAVRADDAVWRRAAEAIAAERLAPGSSVLPPPDRTWTVAVCTRDRPQLLQRALKSIASLEPAPPQVIVVDNAPSDDETRKVADGFDVDYLVEPRPGLNRARRRAAMAATGDVVLYTDDDVVVDPAWARGLIEPFRRPRVGATTGLTLPYELETEAQEMFEQRGGLGKGFVRRDLDFTTTRPARAGSFGAGASMAFSREALDEVRPFDVDLDCGTPARTGGDVYAFYRVVRAGYRLVYTPEAVAWHRHRVDRDALKNTLESYSTGGFTWLLRAALHDRDHHALRVASQWFRRYHLRRLGGALRNAPDATPLDIVLAEIRGALAAPVALARTRSIES